MIYTLTFNRALDCYMRSPSIHQGNIHRGGEQTFVFGGKGVNVSVMLSRLGVPNTAWYFGGGFVGEGIGQYLTAEGVTPRMITLPHGHSRVNMKLMHEDGSETQLNGSGPCPTPAAMEELFSLVDALTQGDILVLSGSVPQGIDRDIYAQILQRLQGKGVNAVVDAEGVWLLPTLPHHPFLIKPNLKELSDMVGRALQTIDEIRQAAEELQAMGAGYVLVSMGERGAMLLSHCGECYVATAPEIDAVSTVGAGDSMVAGFLAGLDRGELYALRLGVASGSATAMEIGLADTERICTLLS